MPFLLTSVRWSRAKLAKEDGNLNRRQCFEQFLLKTPVIFMSRQEVFLCEPLARDQRTLVNKKGTSGRLRQCGVFSRQWRWQSKGVPAFCGIFNLGKNCPKRFRFNTPTTYH
jgi:hypothetical protein